MKIGIVILNYNTKKETIRCVNSIRNFKMEYEELVIVDNGSKENLGDLYKLRDEKTVLLKSATNKGFARGNNVGIRYLRKKGVDFVVLLNSDTEILDKDFLKKMVEVYQENETRGVIGVQRIKERLGIRDGFVMEDISLGYVFWHFFEGICKKIYLGLPFQYKTLQCTQRIHGCAFALTPSYFRCFKGLWKHTFLYREEVILNDLCRKANLEIAFADTCIFHMQGSSSEQDFSRYSRTKRTYELQSTVQHLIVKLLPLWVLQKLI